MFFGRRANASADYAKMNMSVRQDAALAGALAEQLGKTVVPAEAYNTLVPADDNADGKILEQLYTKLLTEMKLWKAWCDQQFKLRRTAAKTIRMEN